METTSPVRVDGRSAAFPILPAAGWTVAAFLAYEAIHFYLRDPLHYILHNTRESFGQFWPHRALLLTHIAGATIALFTGPFQLWSGFRRRHTRIHRATGYIYIAGIAVGGAGAFALSMYTLSVDRGVALFVFASAWWITVAMAFLAIRRGRIEAHREWMIRGYVITFAFVTVRVLLDMSVFKPLGDAGYPTAVWLAWVVPLGITEIALQLNRLASSR